MGRWRKCLGKGRRPAYITRFVRIHVGVGQRGRAQDVESPALRVKKHERVTFHRGNGTRGSIVELTSCHTSTCAAVSIPLGRWKKGSGRFRKQAHICCLVLVHIRVDQRRFASRVNNDTTTLRATRAKSSSIGAMERYMRGFDSAHNSRSPATTHHNSEHIPVGRWKTLHRVRVGAKLTKPCHSTPHNSERTSGAMERTHGFDSRENSQTATEKAYSNGQHFSGAMDESSGQGQKASIHDKPCCHGYCSLQS